jgi:hypothetical protein
MVSKTRKPGSGCLVLVNLDDRLGTRVRAVGHVLLLPHLGLRRLGRRFRAVGEEDGHRVVVCLGKSSPGGRAITSLTTLPAKSSLALGNAEETPSGEGRHRLLVGASSLGERHLPLERLSERTAG